MNTSLLSIVIPIYNEVQTLSELICQVENSPTQISKEIVLVDAGSNDGSTQIIERYAGKPGFSTVFLNQKSGKGQAVREGLKRATGQIIIIQDGDLEYDPMDYAKLLSPLLQGKSDFVLGSRRMDAGAWNFRSFKRSNLYFWLLDLGDIFLTKAFCFLFQVSITDPLTMFKVFHRKHLDESALECTGFDLDWEILCTLLKSGHTFFEVPVSYVPRTPKEGKKISPLKDGLRALRVILYVKFKKIGLKPVSARN